MGGGCVLFTTHGPDLGGREEGDVRHAALPFKTHTPLNTSLPGLAGWLAGSYLLAVWCICVCVCAVGRSVVVFQVWSC